MKEKLFFVADQYDHRLIDATSARKACESFQRDVHGRCNPKLSKTFIDSSDGNTYHNGYVCGQSWMMVGEVTLLRNPV